MRIYFDNGYQSDDNLDIAYRDNGKGSRVPPEGKWTMTLHNLIVRSNSNGDLLLSDTEIPNFKDVRIDDADVTVAVDVEQNGISFVSLTDFDYHYAIDDDGYLILYSGSVGNFYVDDAWCSNVYLGDDNVWGRPDTAPEITPDADYIIINSGATSWQTTFVMNNLSNLTGEIEGGLASTTARFSWDVGVGDNKVMGITNIPVNSTANAKTGYLKLTGKRTDVTSMTYTKRIPYIQWGGSQPVLDKEFKFQKNSLYIPSSGTSGEIGYTADNVGYIGVSQSDSTMSPTDVYPMVDVDKKTVTVKYLNPNETETPKHVDITLNGYGLDGTGALSTTFRLIQAGSGTTESSLALGNDSLTVSASETTATNTYTAVNLMNITAEVQQQISGLIGNIKLAVNSNDIMATFDANKSSDTKTATIVVTGDKIDGTGSISKTFTITQNGKAGGASIRFTEDIQEVAYNVASKSNTMTTANISNLSASVSGNLLNAVASINGSTVIVTFGQNEDRDNARQGIVTVKGTAADGSGEYSQRYIINQGANTTPEMKLAWYDKEVEAYDTSVQNSYTVKNVTNVTATGSEDTTVAITSFSVNNDNQTITIKFGRNTDTTASKVAYFNLVGTGLDGKRYSIPFQFTQKKAVDLPPSIELGWTSKTVEASATSVTNTYTSANLINLKATITGTLSNANVNINNGNITVTFGENKSSLAGKVGVVTVTGTRIDGKGEYSQSFTINQLKSENISIEISAQPTKIGSSGGTVYYTAVTNAPMTGTTPNEDYYWQLGDNTGTFTELGMTYDDATGNFTARAKLVLGVMSIARDSSWTAKFVPFYNGSYDYSCEPVTVTQEGAEPSLTIEFEKSEVDAASGQNKFVCQTNMITDGGVTFTGENCTIVNINNPDGTYIKGTVAYSANTGSTPRTISVTAKQTFNSIEYKSVATFIQKIQPPQIGFGSDVVSATADSIETKNLYIAVNVSGLTATVTGTLVNASARLTKESGVDYVVVSYAKNTDTTAREATVTLSGRDPDGNTVMKSFTIRQQGTTVTAGITLGWLNQTVDAKTTTITNTFIAEGVTGITATVTGTLVNASATINGNNVDVQFDANTSSSQRQGTVTLSGNSGKATAQFSITQDGKDNVVEPTITFLWDSKNYEWNDVVSTNQFSYTNLNQVTVTVGGGLQGTSIETVTGTTSTTDVTVRFAKNTTDVARTGYVTVKGKRIDGNGEFSKSYTIIQNKFNGTVYVTTEESPNTVNFNGGVVYLTGTTNTNNYGGQYRWNVNQSFGSITEISSSVVDGVLTVKAKATCPENTTGSVKNFTVRFEPFDTKNGWLTIGNTVSFKQSSGQDVQTPSISFDWGNKVVDANSTQTTNEFSYWNLGGITAKANNGASAVISGKVILITYPINTATTSKTYTVTLTGTRVDGYGTYSKSFTLTQSSSASGDVEPVWKDDSISVVGDYTQYTLFADGETVYEGAVYGLDGRAELSVNDIAKQYLSYDDIKWGTEKSVNSNYCRSFSIADDSGETIFKRSYFNSYGYDNPIPMSGNLMVLSEPIDGDIPFGAEIPLSVFSKTSVTYSIYKGNTVAFNGTNPSRTNTNHLLRADGVNVPYIIGGVEYYRSVPRCEGQYVIYYVNAFGGWDALLVKGNSKRSDNISIYSYDRKRDNTTARHQSTRYMDDITPKWELHTSWLDDEHSRRMHHLLESNMTYLYDVINDRLIPTVVTDTKCDWLTYRNNGRKMVNYTITMNESQKKDRR